MAGAPLTVGDLVGLPYVPGGAGPLAFDCWGLVRFYFSAFRCIEFPEVFVAQVGRMRDNQQAISEIAREVGWRPMGALSASRHLQADDILVLQGLQGRHVGVVVRDGWRLGLLHCEGTALDPKPGVCFEPIAQVLTRYRHPEVWRHHP